MIITETYTFTTPANYAYSTSLIEIVGSKGKLKLYDLPNQIFNQPFDSDSGFVYDSAKAEFVSGTVRQKDKVPTNAVIGANFATNQNLEAWVSGSLSGTYGGTASVSSGKLVCTGGGVAYCKYDNSNVPLQVGTIRFKYTPNYSGSPSTGHYIFSDNATSGFDNEVAIYHASIGSLNILAREGVTFFIPNTNLGTWSPIFGQEYEFEINYDFTTGATRLFIDGVQFGSTLTQTGTRTSNGKFILGANYSETTTSDGSFDDLLIFTSVQHTSNYTPGYTIPTYKYALTDVILPEMHYTGAGTLQILQSFVTSESGSPRYTLQVGRSGNYLYWNGSNWVISDGSYDQANDAITFNTNSSSLDIVGEVYGQFKIIFTNSNTISSVSDLTATVTGQQYSTANPKITPDNFLFTDDLTAISEVVTKSGSDNIKYTMSVDGTEKYWNGSAWVNTNNGYSQTNTIEEILTNISSLVSVGAQVKPVIYLHSENGQTTPEIDTLSISGDYSGPLPTPPTVIPVYGYIYDASGEPLSDVSVKAFLNSRSAYNLTIDISTGRITTTTDSNGYWELELIETTNMPSGSKYIILLEGTNYVKAYQVSVPSGAVSYNIQDLT